MKVAKSALLRQLALLCAMLMSGGWLLFPRLPLLFVVAACYLLLCGRRLGIDRRLVLVLGLLAAIFFVALIRDAGSGAGALAIRFANFMAGLLVLDLYLRAGMETFRLDLLVITRCMAWQALLTVVLAAVASPLFLPVDVEGVEYHSFLLIANYHTVYEDAGPFVRPDGFFFEPGVFQIYLNLYLYLALYIYRRPGQALLALLAVLATQSTTGLVSAFILCGVYAFRYYVNQGPMRVRVGRFAVAVPLVVALSTVVAFNAADKIVGESRGSFWSRQYDLLTGINVISENPLLGIGFEYEDYYSAATRLGYADTQLGEHITIDRGNTNGIVFLLYSVGIPLALPLLVGMFRQRFFPHRVLVGGIVFLSLLSESIVFTPFFLALMFSGLLIRLPAGFTRAGLGRISHA